MAGASYSLGPVSRAVSQDEVSAMSYVWEKTRFTHRPCVVADTYPLLLLEANSAKKIIGGGLPIDENFSQPERVSLYEGFLKNKDIYYFNKAADIAVAQSCMFVVKSDIIKDKADELTARGVKIESFGTMSVLEY